MNILTYDKNNNMQLLNLFKEMFVDYLFNV